VDPAKLLAFGVTLPQVEQAIAGANANAGGGYIAHGYEKQVVRGLGLFTSESAIAQVAVTSRGGVPVRVSDVGTVRVGGAPREGIVARDSADDVVEGIVLMRKGENALSVLKGVRAKTAELNSTILPRDVQLVPFYDRATLISHTVDTVEENLAIGAVLVLVLLLVFLGDARSALIVATVIPLSLLGVFVMMDVQHVSANLVSLGAVDFGLIVDAAVVMVEACLVRLALQPALEGIKRRELIADTAEVMGRPMLFSVAVVICAFLPIFTFQRVEKRIFSPMAFTLTFALLGSLIVSVTLIPVLASFLMKPRHGRGDTRATRLLRRAYTRLLDWALAHGRRMVVGALALLTLALGLGARLGTEFLPTLDEGNIWLRVTMPVGISLEQAKVIERRIRGILQSYPQISLVVTQLGRPDDGTDAKGSNNLEIYAELRPRRQWGNIPEKDQLIDGMYARLSAIPGLSMNFSQYIKDNVEEALSGVTGELVVKIFGPDLGVLQEKAADVQRVLATVRGVADLASEQQFGQPQLRLVIERQALARYGLNVSDVNDAIETAIGGRAVTQFLDDEKVFDVRVRYTAPSRTNLQALRDLPVNTPDGRTITLSAVARVVPQEGASRIARDGNQRRIAVKCSVRGRDQGGWVAEAQRKVDAAVSLPPGYRMWWGGQFENQRRAMARLGVIVPASLVLIFILLFSAFGSARYATLILGNLPFALIGGIVILWSRSIHLSVSAAVGFIALFGIAVQNGVIMMSEFNRLRLTAAGIDEAVRQGALNRVRPVVMTASMAALGLLPMALSTGVGAETTRPFASVIVGGLLTATPLTLLLLPVLYRAFHETPGEDLAE
jgi:cobalt-zinc-cadmium resistance protein CzcA